MVIYTIADTPNQTRRVSNAHDSYRISPFLDTRLTLLQWYAVLPLIHTNFEILTSQAPSLYTFSSETLSELKRFRFASARATSMQAIICMYY